MLTYTGNDKDYRCMDLRIFVAEYSVPLFVSYIFSYQKNILRYNFNVRVHFPLILLQRKI
jgi:hypothetical protein